ncbi:hypothetical protein RUM43_012201 [Polyplax serrata]|uniref:Uncharacterized protein n=1 Tax=Polyplax serrata TaxID=468196 RepID=A0AAN8NKA0_POLSC
MTKAIGTVTSQQGYANKICQVEQMQSQVKFVCVCGNTDYLVTYFPVYRVHCGTRKKRGPGNSERGPPSWGEALLSRGKCHDVEREQENAREPCLSTEIRNGNRETGKNELKDRVERDVPCTRVVSTTTRPALVGGTLPNDLCLSLQEVDTYKGNAKKQISGGGVVKKSRHAQETPRSLLRALGGSVKTDGKDGEKRCLRTRAERNRKGQEAKEDRKTGESGELGDKWRRLVRRRPKELGEPGGGNGDIHL